jgi:hypothetical protein
MTMRFAAAFLFLGAMLAVTSYSDAQQRGGQPGQPGQKGGFGKGGFGKGGFGGFGQIGQILSTGLQDTLKMTDDQKKQLADLQKDVDAKLAKILTEDQQKQLKELKEQRPMGGFGGGGFGKGGFGKGDKGNPPPKKDPPQE